MLAKRETYTYQNYDGTLDSGLSITDSTLK